MSGPALYTSQINLSKNDDWVQSFTYTDAFLVPINLTGSIFRLQVRRLEIDAEALIDISSPGTGYVGTGIVITNPTAGQFTITILRSLMANIPPANDYVQDLVRIKPDGTQERMWEGTATVVTGTTR
jgi:hypothetical protein